MSFESFYDAIESDALRSIARHWNEARGSRLMPGWQDIKPSAISKHLAIVWSWKYDSSTDEFTGRLAGERIQNAFGVNFRGAKMRDVFKDRSYDQISARHRRVVTTAALFLGRGLVFRHLDRFDIGERIVLPLSNGGSAGDGILGATDFKSYNDPIADDLLRRGEIEAWFSL